MADKGTEGGKIFLGLHLNSKPIMNQMGALRPKLESSFGSIGKDIGKKLAAGLSIAAVGKFAKSCLDLGSDLSEVQNVVDTTFGSMSARVNEWASGAITSIGLSETMAKQFSGFYGAMAKSAGITGDALYDMSTNLTALAADVASFYNLDPEESYTKLKAVFSGETEGLKSIGVMMTQTALDQYAMENGFGKTTAAMTEQEKVMLRYQYVMSALSDASGDFARTSDSWANQTRVLRLQLEQLQATIGQGLIAALSPAIRALNKFMGALVKAANTFKAFIFSLMGKKSTDMAAGAGAISEALGDITSGAGGASDALGGVGKSAGGAAKDIRRALFGFDEINKVLDESSSGGGGGGSGGSGGGGGGSDLGDTASALISEAYDIENTFADQLAKAFDAEDWEGLGGMLGRKINKMIDKVPWADLGEKFGKGVNAIVGTTYWTLDTVDFENLGSHFAEFLNSALDKALDSNTLNEMGRLLTKRFTILLDTAIGFVTNLDTADIGQAIHDFFVGRFDEWTEWFESYDWGELADTLYQKIKDLFAGLNWTDIAASAVRQLGTALGSAGKFIGTFVGNLTADFKAWFDENLRGEDWVSTAQNILNWIATGFSNLAAWVDTNFITPFMNALGVGDAWANVKTVGSNVMEKIRVGWPTLKAWVSSNVIEPMSGALKTGE